MHENLHPEKSSIKLGTIQHTPIFLVGTAIRTPTYWAFQANSGLIYRIKIDRFIPLVCGESIGIFGYYIGNFTIDVNKFTYEITTCEKLIPKVVESQIVMHELLSKRGTA